MKVVSNKVVFFISFLLDCVTTHTACQTVHIPGVGLGGGLGEENAYFQGCYLPSKGRAVDTILVIGHPALGHPVEDCGGGIGPVIKQMQTFLGAVPGVSTQLHLAT